MNSSTIKHTNDSSYNEYLTNVITTVDANIKNQLANNEAYSDSLNILKNKASMYVNSVNTSNRNLKTEKEIMTENKTKLLSEYNKEVLEFSKITFSSPDITSHEDYIKKLTTEFEKFQISVTKIGKKTTTKLNNTAVNIFKKHVETTYTNLNTMLADVYDYHRKCKPYIKKYGICSTFYDNYLNTMTTEFIKVVKTIQEYNIIRIDPTSDGINKTSNRIYGHELFLTNTNEQSTFNIDQENINNLATIKDTKSVTVDLQIILLLNDYINSLKSRRSSLTDKTINVLDEILSDNCDFALTASYSKFNDYTLSISIEYAIERNDVHNYECKNFLYTLFNNLKKVRDNIKTTKTSPFTGDLSESLTVAFSDIQQRRQKYTIKIISYGTIYVRLPYLINYCELISLCIKISKQTKSSFGDILNEIFNDLSKINVSSVEGEQIKSDAIYDKLLTSIITNYILDFNMIAFHKNSNTVLTPEVMNKVNLSNILYNITTNNFYLEDIDRCSMTKKPTDISKGSGKTMLSLVICYVVFIVAIAFNVVMFIFKEKIKAKFNNPTTTKIINNIFYWINLGCIIAAGVSSFLRITDVYSTSFFTRLGVIVTVNVITMIFCSFSLYFIDPNTFWNTTAKTGETKNTENNNSNTDANANDNADAKQQSSN